MLEEHAKKITEALYRVTNLFPDKEPLKWQLRNNAVEIFDLILSVSKNNQNEQNAVLLDNLFHKINHLFNLALFSGVFIANVNFDILKREYLVLAKEVENNLLIKKPKEITFPKGFLMVSDISIGQSIGHNGQSDGHNGQKENKENKEENNRQNIQLNERKKQILAFIRPDEWKTIKEIAVSLPEIGEKSIQRELLEMVEAGILKKTGDKRWRKYSISKVLGQD